MRPAAVVAGALFLAACGILPGPVPEWVVNRQPLESCGEEVLSQGEPHDQAVRGCLLQAFEDGRGAELISRQPTIEGDPITRYLRVHENGVVEIFVDATGDRFGSGRWERIVCDELVPVGEANDPPDVVFPAEMVFVENGCEELPVP
jgi:hypothetical protein